MGGVGWGGVITHTDFFFPFLFLVIVIKLKLENKIIRGRFIVIKSFKKKFGLNSQQN